MNRRYIAAIAAIALSALAGTSANAVTTVVPMGTADTVVDLADLAVSGLPVDGISVGQVRSFASTDSNTLYNPLGDGSPFAIAKVSLPDGSEQSVRSDGDTGQKGTTVPIADVGDVTVGDLTATAGEAGAQSLVNAVEGELNAVIAGLKARAAGVNARVTGDASTTTNGVVLENISVGLTDLLPADLLAQLPLDKLISLADSLGIDVNLGPLDGAVEEVRKLAATVDAVVRTEEKLEELEVQIDAVRDTMGGGVAAAQKSVDDAQAAVNAASATLSSLSTQHSSVLAQYASAGCATLSILPGCDALAAQIADLEQQVASQEQVVAARQASLAQAQAALATAQQGVGAVQAEIDKLQEQIDALAATLDDLLDRLIELARKVATLDLEGILQGLLEGLEGVELIGVDRLSFGVSTLATATSSKSSTVCDVSGVRVLGEQRQAADCGELEKAAAEVERELEDLLALLPVQGVIPADAVSVDGPRLSSSPEGYSAGGYRVATAKVNGLNLTVEPIELTEAVDGLVVQARALVSGTLAQIEAATGIEVPVDVNAALDELLAQLNALPIGDTLNGVTTPRVAISAVDLGSRSTFRAAGSGEDSHPVMPGAPESPNAPVTPVTPGTNLPHTGGGIGLALALLAAGGTMWGIKRPRRATQP